MLKLFYKTILVSVISGSLLLLDFSFKGSLLHLNSVQAETLKTDAIKDSDMMGTLTMTVVGTLASRLYRYKPTTDIMLTAAGGTIFIAGEILAFIKLKNVMKDIETNISRDEEGRVDQKQIEVLEKLKQSYLEAKKTAEIKKNLQLAAAAAFAAAGIVAYTMAAGEMGALSACSTGITTALSGLSASLGSCVGPQAPACTAQIGSCITMVTAYQTGLMSHELARQAPGPSLPGLTADTSRASALSTQLTTITGACAGFGSAALTLQPACTPLTLVQTQNASGGPPPTAAAYEAPKKSWMDHFLEKGLDFIMPSAHAELFSLMGIAAGAAITFLLATSATLGPQIDLFMLIPKNRAIIWAVLAGMTYSATTATNNQIQKIEANIQKINSILESMYALNNGVAAANASVVSPKINATIINNQNVTLGAIKNQDVDLGMKEGGTLPCMTSDKADKCPSFSNKLNAQVDIKSMPDSVQTQVGTIGKIADGLNAKSKISGATLDLAQGLAGQQNALKLELQKQQKSLQEKLKASGDKTSITGEIAKLDSDLKMTIQKELDSKKTTASAMMANMGLGAVVDSNPLKLPDGEKKTKFVPKATLATFAPTTINSAASADHSGLDADLKGKKAEEPSTVAQASTGKTATMDDYELKNDITHDKDSSIFDLISNRYQKSYERLFNRIK